MMNFVDTLDIMGTAVRLIPCITGNGAPTAETDGDVGALYLDKTGGTIYVCTDTGTWKPLTVSVDSALSDTSENPVQNKTVKAAIDAKIDKTAATTDTFAANTLPLRGTDGNFSIGTPTADNQAATKKYVDDAVASGGSVTVDTALSDSSENPVQNKVVKAALDKKLTARTDGASQVRFYAITTDGQQTTYRATDTATYNTVPLRNAKGNFLVGTPTVDTECANKKYVDDAIAGVSSGGGVNTFYTTTKNVPKSFVTANNGVVVVYGSVAYSAGSNPWTATIPLDAFSESSAYNYTFRVLAPTSLADTGADGSSQGATPFIQITMTEGTDSYTLSATSKNFSSASVTISSLYGIGTAKSGS